MDKINAGGNDPLLGHQHEVPEVNGLTGSLNTLQSSVANQSDEISILWEYVEFTRYALWAAYLIIFGLGTAVIAVVMTR